jgi:effector-binding domain-containing protein
VISSLRLADVPIKDIQAYLKEDDDITQKGMMEKWIQIIKNRQEILNVSLRYLESNYASERIHLIEKIAESVIWFSAESEIGKFRDHVSKRMKELEILNIPIKSCYLKYLSGKDLIKAQIGFGIHIDIQTNDLSDVELIEHMDPCICIALSFNEPITEIQAGYRKLINYASENN